MQVFFQDNLHFFAAAKVAKVVHVFFFHERLQKSLHLPNCLPSLAFFFAGREAKSLRQSFWHVDLHTFLGSTVVVVTVVGGTVVAGAGAPIATRMPHMPERKKLHSPVFVISSVWSSQLLRGLLFNSNATHFGSAAHFASHSNTPAAVTEVCSP
jgi:hypothetical protein